MNHNYFHWCSEKVHLYSEEHGIEPTSPETDVQLPQIHPSHPKEHDEFYTIQYTIYIHYINNIQCTIHFFSILYHILYLIHV